MPTHSPHAHRTASLSHYNHLKSADGLRWGPQRPRQHWRRERRGGGGRGGGRGRGLDEAVPCAQRRGVPNANKRFERSADVSPSAQNPGVVGAEAQCSQSYNRMHHGTHGLLPVATHARADTEKGGGGGRGRETGKEAGRTPVARATGSRPLDNARAWARRGAG